MAAPPPDQPPESLILQSFTGLKNVVSRERLTPNELAKAINVDLDALGQPRRRRGYTLVSAGKAHSLWNAPGRVLVVKDGTLGIITTDYTFLPLQSGIGDERLAYTEVNGVVFFSNSTVSGKIILASVTVEQWGHIASASQWLSPVVQPTDTLNPVAGKLIGPPPVAQHLAHLNGRIYLAREKMVWATELFAFDYVDRTRTWIQFEHDIAFMIAVADGLYVGTDGGVFFLSGPFGQMARRQISDSPAVPFSAVAIQASLVKQSLNQSNADALACVYMTAAGVVAGFNNGTAYNLTQDKYEFPAALAAAPMVREQDGMVQYLATLDHGGDPVNGARFGDYVDAEIIRA